MICCYPPLNLLGNSQIWFSPHLKHCLFWNIKQDTNAEFWNPLKKKKKLNPEYFPWMKMWLTDECFVVVSCFGNCALVVLFNVMQYNVCSFQWLWFSKGVNDCFPNILFYCMNGSLIEELMLKLLQWIEYFDWKMALVLGGFGAGPFLTLQKATETDG